MLTGDAWRRGVATLIVREVGTETRHRLFYANGPVFQPLEHDVLPAVRPLAIYESETFSVSAALSPGEDVQTVDVQGQVIPRGGAAIPTNAAPTTAPPRTPNTSP